MCGDLEQTFHLGLALLLRGVPGKTLLDLEDAVCSVYLLIERLGVETEFHPASTGDVKPRLGLGVLVWSG